MADRLDEEDYVNMEVSPLFAKRATRMYAASPESIQLRAICQYYYQFGMQLGNVVPDISLVLRNTFIDGCLSQMRPPNSTRCRSIP